MTDTTITIYMTLNGLSVLGVIVALIWRWRKGETLANNVILAALFASQVLVDINLIPRTFDLLFTVLFAYRAGRFIEARSIRNQIMDCLTTTTTLTAEVAAVHQEALDVVADLRKGVTDDVHN